MNKLNKNKKAGEVVWRGPNNIETMYEKLLINKLTVVLADNSHPLRQELDIRCIDRSGRFI